MTDIAAAVGGFAGIAPLPGLEDSWTWAVGNRFSYAIALSADGNHAFQLNCKGPLDVDLAVSVLSHARAHTGQALQAVPLAVIHGFTPPPSVTVEFDVVAAAAPAVHRHQLLQHPDLHKVTYAVFPAYHCEFSGREDESEAITRIGRMLDISNMHRLAVPWLRMRYDNPKTGAGSIGDNLGLTTPGRLTAELRNLENAEGAWIEFENFQNIRLRAAWENGKRLLTSGDDTRSWIMTDLLAHASTFLFEGIDHES